MTQMKLNRLFTSAAGAMCLLTAAAAHPAINFTSNDSALNSTFEWARDMAMSYVHDGSDPVGLWYEAALPGRESFCIRDLSHQAIAGHLLGLAAHNRNMTGRIAANISDNRDWCSFWETDRLDRPTPCDYKNDKEFWYNLPANFDLMRACHELYEWTGDKDYLKSPEYLEFYRRTAHDYVDRWNLHHDSIMGRQRIMNTRRGLDFYTCRGLPSYAENFSGITVAIDLIGAARKGYEAYAEICRLNGDSKEAAYAADMADGYKSVTEDTWWDDSLKRYNTYYKEDGSFHRGEGIPYMLLIKAIDCPERAAAAVADVLSRDWNVENLSAFPYFLYRLGYGAKARELLTSLPSVKRADYPEVSYGAIEGIFRGLMGIEASASRQSVTTCHRSDNPDATSTATSVPVAGGTIDVAHKGNTSSTLTNNTDRKITWEAAFAGSHDALYHNGKKLKTSSRHDPAGTCVTYATIKVSPGKSATISAVR